MAFNGTPPCNYLNGLNTGQQGGLTATSSENLDLRVKPSLRPQVLVPSPELSPYEVIHTRPEVNTLKMSELTEWVNASLRERRELGNLKKKRVGNILTSMHLTNRQRLNSGYVLWLDRKTREEIHSPARTYGLNTGPTSEMPARCELCRIMSGRPTGGSTKKHIGESGRTEANGPERYGQSGARLPHKRRGQAAISCTQSCSMNSLNSLSKKIRRETHKSLENLFFTLPENCGAQAKPAHKTALLSLSSK